MNENDFTKEPLEDEIGTEVVDDFAQNIPGTAPSFDTITEEELKKQKEEETSDDEDDETYRATSINFNKPKNNWDEDLK